jgi:GTPase SAR1 family protein
MKEIKSMYVEIAGAALLLVENRKKIFPFFRRFRSWIKQGRVKVIVFGSGGVGKTSLGKLLVGQSEISGGMRDYKMSREIEDYRLPGDVLATVIVPPGQESRRKATWKDLYRDLSLGKCKIIVNVVAAGFHSIDGLSYTDSKYYQPGWSQEEFLANYRKECNERELGVREITPFICKAKGHKGKQEKLWMITLVTKQDLWWSERVEIRKHYEEGPYNEYIKEIISERGQQNFEHIYLSSSLTMSNFMTSKGEVLANTVSGYDQPIQVANLKALFDTITGFLKAQ